MHATSGGRTSFQNIKKSKLFENLNDAYVCNLKIKIIIKKYVHKKSRIGILKERNVFWKLVAKFCKVLCEFLSEAKVRFSLSDAYRIIECRSLR